MGTVKINREEVYKKCNGRCAYCGVEITIKQMQVDHIVPHWHTCSDEEVKRMGLVKGSHEFDNLNPSCSRCNKWKSTYTIEKFRGVIETSINRLERDTPNFRLARDYGLLVINENKVKFYYETLHN